MKKILKSIGILMSMLFLAFSKEGQEFEETTK